MIKIFISHSSKDVKFVSLITDLLMDALPISKDEIRCTSVPGFRLSAGAHTSHQLRKELNECKTIIGVLTDSSLASSYVLFELGAGWGLNKRVLPILGPGAKYSDLRPPLSELHSIQYSDDNSWYRLIEDLANELQETQKSPSFFSSRVNNLVTYTNP